MDRAARNVQRWLGWSEAEARHACGAGVAQALGL
jgi:hypothetical protein